MNIKKHIPNFLTCCNLLCGCLGLIVAFYAESFFELSFVSYLIFAACIFDFFDGFVARLLKVSSPIGKELDSLADMVTFGVLPGIIILKFLEFTTIGAPGLITQWAHPLPEISGHTFYPQYGIYLQLIALLIPVFSALRLAKFNIDTRQADSFIGVPTPTNAILIASFPLIVSERTSTLSNSLLEVLASQDKVVQVLINPISLVCFTLLMSYLLVAELPLIALKFKKFNWVDNKFRFILLFSVVILLISLKWTAIPFIVVLYIILSIIENKLFKASKSHI